MIHLHFTINYLHLFIKLHKIEKNCRICLITLLILPKFSAILRSKVRAVPDCDLMQLMPLFEGKRNEQTCWKKLPVFPN